MESGHFIKSPIVAILPLNRFSLQIAADADSHILQHNPAADPALEQR
ncbi:MAG: hypothetical protein ABIK07_22580 [Planctomycetota bacterium]